MVKQQQQQKNTIGISFYSSIINFSRWRERERERVEKKILHFGFFFFSYFSVVLVICFWKFVTNQFLFTFPPSPPFYHYHSWFFRILFLNHNFIIFFYSHLKWLNKMTKIDLSNKKKSNVKPHAVTWPWLRIYLFIFFSSLK